MGAGHVELGAFSDSEGVVDEDGAGVGVPVGVDSDGLCGSRDGDRSVLRDGSGDDEVAHVVPVGIPLVIDEGTGGDLAADGDSPDVVQGDLVLVGLELGVGCYDVHYAGLGVGDVEAAGDGCDGNGHAVVEGDDSAFGLAVEHDGSPVEDGSGQSAAHVESTLDGEVSSGNVEIVVEGDVAGGAVDGDGSGSGDVSGGCDSGSSEVVVDGQGSGDRCLCTLVNLQGAGDVQGPVDVERGSLEDPHAVAGCHGCGAVDGERTVHADLATGCAGEDEFGSVSDLDLAGGVVVCDVGVVHGDTSPLVDVHDHEDLGVDDGYAGALPGQEPELHSVLVDGGVVGDVQRGPGAHVEGDVCLSAGDACDAGVGSIDEGDFQVRQVELHSGGNDDGAVDFDGKSAADDLNQFVVVGYGEGSIELVECGNIIVAVITDNLNVGPHGVDVGSVDVSGGRISDDAVGCGDAVAGEELSIDPDSNVVGDNGSLGVDVWGGFVPVGGEGDLGSDRDNQVGRCGTGDCVAHGGGAEGDNPSDDDIIGKTDYGGGGSCISIGRLVVVVGARCRSTGTADVESSGVLVDSRQCPHVGGPVAVRGEGDLGSVGCRHGNLEVVVNGADDDNGTLYECDGLGDAVSLVVGVRDPIDNVPYLPAGHLRRGGAVEHCVSAECGCVLAVVVPVPVPLSACDGRARISTRLHCLESLFGGDGGGRISSVGCSLVNSDGSVGGDSGPVREIEVVEVEGHVALGHAGNGDERGVEGTDEVTRCGVGCVNVELGALGHVQGRAHDGVGVVEVDDRVGSGYGQFSALSSRSVVGGELCEGDVGVSGNPHIHASSEHVQSIVPCLGSRGPGEVVGLCDAQNRVDVFKGKHGVVERDGLCVGFCGQGRNVERRPVRGCDLQVAVQHEFHVDWFVRGTDVTGEVQCHPGGHGERVG